MYIKSSTVIPAGTKITKLEPRAGTTKSLYSLERAHERQLEKQARMKDNADRFRALLAHGVPAADAAKICSE